MTMAAAMKKANTVTGSIVAAKVAAMTNDGVTNKRGISQ